MVEYISVVLKYPDSRFIVDMGHNIKVLAVQNSLVLLVLKNLVVSSLLTQEILQLANHVSRLLLNLPQKPVVKLLSTHQHTELFNLTVRVITDNNV